jgi:hypothetical protein
MPQAESAIGLSPSATNPLRLLVEGLEVADRARLAAGRCRFLLQDVLGLERLEPGRAIGMRQHRRATRRLSGNINEPAEISAL